MREKWKNLPGYKGVYQASNRGRIKRKIGGPGIVSGRILKQSCNSRGYVCISIHKKSQYVHRIILSTFSGPCPDKMECRHLDGNKSNNCSDNLAWGTKSENQQDCIRHGTRIDNRGSKHWNSKLKEPDILKIRQLITSGDTHQKIANIFGVARITITDIAIGKTWTHV